MGRRSLLFLFLAAILAGLATWLALRDYREEVQRVAEIRHLFPDLPERISTVRTLKFTERGESFHLVFDPQGQEWVIREKHNYPADNKKISEWLNVLVSSKILEPRTDRPDKHRRLHLGPPDDPDSRSFGVQLLDGEGAIVADLIIGKQRRSKGGAPQQFYVRRGGENESWLAVGELDPDRRPRDWIDRQLIDISHERIREIRIGHPGEAVLVINRDDPQGEFRLRDFPDRRTPNQQKMVSASYGMQKLPVNDVYLVEEMPQLDWDDSTRVSFTTFDGLRIDTQAIPAGDHFYQRLAVTYDPDTGRADRQNRQVEDNDERRPIEEVAVEVREVNQGLAPWIFLVPGHTVDTFTPRLDDLAPPG